MRGCRPLWPHGALGEALALGAGAALGCAAYLAGLLLLRGIRKKRPPIFAKGTKKLQKCLKNRDGYDIIASVISLPAGELRKHQASAALQSHLCRRKFLEVAL